MNESRHESAARRHIVVVDDDELMRETLETFFSRHGFDVTGFGDGPSALDFLTNENSADLALLDWRMSPMSGIELLKKLREAGVKVPIVFLTGLTDQIYEEAALDDGAVDFVEKSRGFAILLKRIELIFGGSKPGNGDTPSSEAEPYRKYGDLEIYGASNQVQWQGRRVPLSLSEVAIVSCLAARSGTDLRYRELYDVVRGENFVAGLGSDGYRTNVRTFIRRIRGKFRRVDEDFDEIENFPGYGYRWRGGGKERT
jgi:two-component system response regulator ChvI